MALELSSQLPILYPTTSPPKTSSYPQISTTQFKPPPIHTKRIIKRSTITRKTTQFTVKAATAAEEENPQPNDTTVSESQSEPETISTQKSSTDEPQSQPTNSTISDLGSEIKKAMKERDAAGGGGDLWSGVAEEIREIEWPAFGKVLGTTGVVLGVIAGSSVVLLTVNAVLAELSDRIFAGKGVQDFFG